MKKKLFPLILCTTAALVTACGAKNTAPSASTGAAVSNEAAASDEDAVSNEATASGEDSSTDEDSSSGDASSDRDTLSTSGQAADGNFSSLDAIGNVGVEKGLLNVEVTVPADFVKEKTQEDLDALAEDKEYHSITLNEDGSATYRMTKKQHKEMMTELSNSIHSSLTEMIGSETYPNITDITTNDDFTEFKVTTKSTELDMGESFTVLGFYIYGGMYNIYNGTPVDNVSVEFINADSGKVISSSNMNEEK